MATARSRKPSSEDAELATFVVEGVEPAATPFAGLFAGPKRAAPSGKRAAEPALALGQMRLAIEDGLLMVFGPEGDPVPPQAFARAAAAQPDAQLRLPEGTTATASRVAAVLRAQALGRLGRPHQGSEWILAMLRESGRPEPASEDQLQAEQAAPATPQDQNAAAREASDQGSLDRAAASRGAGDRGAGNRSADDLGGGGLSLVQDGGAGTADDVASTPAPGMIALGLCPQALAGDGFHALVVRDVPAGARLSAGAYNAAIDGWVLQPHDLGTLTILPPPELCADFTVTLVGLALRPGDANPIRVLAWLPVTPGPRVIALGLNPQALADEGFEALVIRDVPASARLSAGAYNPAIDGWVLQPHDLGTLTILPPPELRADFTVTLVGLALRPGDANAIRVLARLPVRIA